MTTTTTRRPGVKTLADFEQRGLIGKWFGDLQLVAVRSAKDKRGIGETLCRVICANAHLFTRPWWELRDQSRKRACARCQPRKATATNLSNDQLLKKIVELTPERRRLFDVILNSRRRGAGQKDTGMRELLNDAYSYARDVPDPEAELRDLALEGNYETYGRSASLCSPSLIYMATE